MANRCLIPLVIAISLIASDHVSATVFVPTDLGELIVIARAIVHGRIVDVRPQLTENRRRVDTLVTIQVATYLKGNLGAAVTFRVPGGLFGRYRTIVLDAPQFKPGEEVVLLLNAQGPSIPYVLGLNQGVFRVVNDATSGERRVAPAPIVGDGIEWKRLLRGDPAHGPVLLTDFAHHVQRVLGARP